MVERFDQPLIICARYSATVCLPHIIAVHRHIHHHHHARHASGAPLPSYPGSGAANVGIGGTSTPSAKLSITSTAEQLRLLYDTTNRAPHTISSAGAYTISTTGTTPANAHLLLNPERDRHQHDRHAGGGTEVRSNSGANNSAGDMTRRVTPA